jgi:hypothetical protein
VINRPLPVVPFDKFLQENMPNAEKVFAGATPTLRVVAILPKLRLLQIPRYQ